MTKTLIKPFEPVATQMCRIGRHRWSVARLIELSKPLDVMDVPLLHLNIYSKYENLTLREMAGHFVAARDADLSFPIILDEDGDIMDGRHRIMKSIIDNKPTIKAVRFLENPSPCQVDDD